MTSMPNGSRPTVLVIGATGRHGGTGARIVEQLLALDQGVRVLVRAPDERVDELHNQGAEVVVGDLLDRRTLIPAVSGVDSVYFAYPIAAGVEVAAVNLASVMRAKPVPRLVVMSMGASAADSASALGRAQWVAEEVFFWAGLNPVVLRVAALFYENILVLHGQSIRSSGSFANSFGAGRAPWIGARDAADLAVAALTSLDRYPQGTVAYPPGAEYLSHAEVAELIAAETGSAVRYTPISREQWQAELEHSAAASPGLINSAMAQHISSIGARFSQPEATPTARPNPQALADAIGHQPLSLTEFIRTNRRSFLRH